MKEQSNYSLIERIYKEKNYITRKDIDSYKIPSWFLTDFVRKNGLIKIAPGVYAAEDFIVDDYFILQKRYPKYIFSGMSSLYLLHLIDKVPVNMYVTGPQGYNPSRLKIDNLIIHKISNHDIYSLGISEIKTMFGNVIYVYDKERTICDLIKYRDHYDSETFLKALMGYSKSGPDQIKLLEYAKKMKLEKKVFELMEIVLNEN